MLEAIRAAFHDPKAAAYGYVNGIVGALIGASVLLLAVEAFLGEGHPWFAVVQAIDAVFLVFFAVELVLRVGTYLPPELAVMHFGPVRQMRARIVGRIAYCFRPLVLVDIITVLALVPALRGLRAIRLLRLLRSTTIFRYANPFTGISYAIQRDRVLFLFAFSVLGGETLLGGVSIFLVEGRANPAIHNLGDGIWWALVTLTTVGFGDITAVTFVGRLVGGVLMVAGMFTLAMFAGVVGHTLMNTVLSIREEEIRMGGHVNHIVVCGYDDGTRMLLDTLSVEVDVERTKIIIFANRPRPHNVPPEFAWIEGDPTKESELGKVRLGYASSVIISGERSRGPQHADATTILTAFTIRSFLANHPDVKRRREPLYVVAEILDSENVEHARTAGADEVIETHRVGFSLLAHAVVHHGTADTLSRVVISGAHNVYEGEIPNSISLPSVFGEVASIVKRDHNALVIGLRLASGGAPLLNPADDRKIERRDRLVYLAVRAVLDDPA